MKKQNILKLIISIFLPLFAGIIGSYFTTPNIESWYLFLDKPALNPPNFIFAPVWTALYILMGISLFLIWSSDKNNKEKKKPLIFFGIQLILNSSWSIIFFGLQNPQLALVNIFILWIFIIITIFSFYKISKKAGIILVPYLLWVTFASYLNYMIYILN